MVRTHGIVSIINQLHGTQVNLRKPTTLPHRKNKSMVEASMTEINHRIIITHISYFNGISGYFRNKSKLAFAPLIGR